MRPVVILENMEHRIAHLRKLIPFTPICWATTVLDLYTALLRSEPPLLVILDHDLGPGDTTSLDLNGHSGMDAALHAPIPPGTRVLVWSWNDVKRPRMALALTKRGFVASGLPFSSPDCDALIIRRAG